MILNVDFIYPIGSIYMNVTNPTNPGVLFGGTWKAIPFRYPVGVGIIEDNNNNVFGSVKDYVGKWSINKGELLGEIQHKLTESEMPTHRHTGFGLDGHLVALGNGNIAGIGIHGFGWNNCGSTFYTNNAGGGLAHDNIPPSIAVYMWQRTA